MTLEERVKELRIKKHKGRETEDFLLDVKKLTEGEAYEYLLGEVLFCGAKIDLSFRPMIPRPETEFWVSQAIEEVKQRGTQFTLRVLDIFSGSGNVGLAFLKNLQESTVDMIEVDPKLKEQINISIIKNQIKKTRTRVLTGDSFEGAVGHYDIITAVPPYVPLSMKEEVMKELGAEDPLSFFDKEDGFYFHTIVLSQGKKFLKDRGTLYLEFDITQREKIEGLVKEYGWSTYHFLKDPYGHECALVLIK